MYCDTLVIGMEHQIKYDTASITDLSVICGAWKDGEVVRSVPLPRVTKAGTTGPSTMGATSKLSFVDNILPGHDEFRRLMGNNPGRIVPSRTPDTGEENSLGGNAAAADGTAAVTGAEAGGAQADPQGAMPSDEQQTRSAEVGRAMMYALAAFLPLLSGPMGRFLGGGGGGGPGGGGGGDAGGGYPSPSSNAVWLQHSIVSFSQVCFFAVMSEMYALMYQRILQVFDTMGQLGSTSTLNPFQIANAGPGGTGTVSPPDFGAATGSGVGIGLTSTLALSADLLRAGMRRWRRVSAFFTFLMRGARSAAASAGRRNDVQQEDINTARDVLYHEITTNQVLTGGAPAVPSLQFDDGTAYQSALRVTRIEPASKTGAARIVPATVGPSAGSIYLHVFGQNDLPTLVTLATTHLAQLNVYMQNAVDAAPPAAGSPPCYAGAASGALGGGRKRFRSRGVLREWDRRALADVCEQPPHDSISPNGRTPPDCGAPRRAPEDARGP